MAFFDFLIPKALKRPLNQFAMIKGIASYGSSNQLGNVNNGYLGNANIYSIIRKIAKTAATIPLNVYTVKDDVAFKQYNNLRAIKDYSPQHMLKVYVKKNQAL